MLDHVTFKNVLGTGPGRFKQPRRGPTCHVILVASRSVYGEQRKDKG